MNVDDIINCVAFQVDVYDKPYFEILGDAINLTPWGFIDYLINLGVDVDERNLTNKGRARYEYSQLRKCNSTHPHIVKQYFEDTPEVRSEWETVDSIIKLLRR